MLFGGLDVNSNTLGDTWTYSGTTWSQVIPSSAPSARAFSAMAYDSTSGNVVLFGGLDNSQNTLGDEWTFASGNWTAQTPPVLPSTRSDDVMTDDTGAGQLVLFGGLDDTGTALSDTWVTVPIDPGEPIEPRRVARSRAGDAVVGCAGPRCQPDHLVHGRDHRHHHLDDPVSRDGLR